MKFSFSTVLFMFAAAACLMTAQAAPAISNLQARSSRYGDATYYAVGLGSCGETNYDDEMVAALSSSLMGGSNSDLCGKYITVESDSGSVTVRVVDSCPACSEDDIDISAAAFEELGNLSSGRIPITWSL
ncbi:barwin-like endoglucanase [Mucor ambiguus]|uniref:Barwin-like endoglucanase n=1 Tax=Mucor ambiguus TaxID=91626 RepID=A0A0C9LXY2_9FUNG|nr:barwin-like endoglucanase [Mucor ambiguus]